jgi:beta-N-acetylhexosaminidase
MLHQAMHSFVGTTVPQAIRDGVRQGDIVAICLFKHNNVESPAQLRDLTLSLWQAAAEGGLPPPLIGIDQEGGQLIAISPGATELPGNMALGATRDPALARQAGRILGRELLAMGINLNFAPAMDVNINPENPVIGVRSFGDNPALVAEMGVAVIQGMQAEGVIATAKHFPGHGDTQLDSHDTAPVISHSLDRVEAVELAPFRAAIEAGVGAVMSAHIRFDALDDKQPATLSRAILTGLLREQMGFNGLIITDAMDMQAVARLGSLESISAAIHAGADLVLLGHLSDQMKLNGETRRLLRPEALARIQTAQNNLPREPLALTVVGSAEHQAVARTIAEHSITLVKGHDTLPLSVSGQLGVISTLPSDLTPADTSASVTVTLSESIRKRHSNLIALEFQRQASEEEIRQTLEACAGAERVVVGTIDAHRDSSQQELIHALCARGQRPVVVAMRTPYDLASFPEVETYLCTYSILTASSEAAARVIFGEIPSAGKLPCQIPGLPVMD